MNRTRLVMMTGVVVVGLLGAGLYFVNARRAASAAAPVSAPTADAATLLREPHLVFRNTVLGPDYGRLGIVALAQPAGGRALEPISCERVYATAQAGVCVTATRGMAPRYGLSTLDAQLRPVAASSLVGLPSRARMSRDATLVATTTFVTGHSYAQSSFSTETIIRQNGKCLGSLESWTTRLPNGTLLSQVDRNYWGVTFAADDDLFYATAASGNTTWLVRGSVRTRTMTALRTDAECPSLSPDGSKVAYKKRLGDRQAGSWRLAVLDLSTGTETLLSETRSVDDQVEWLDGNRVLYGLARAGSDATTSDIWVVPADGSGSPAVLVDHASSPAVVRL